MVEKKWPSFVTKDLGDSPEDDDSWWVDTATGELIGPDPDIERPLTSDELAMAVPLVVAFPDLAESIKRGAWSPQD